MFSIYAKSAQLGISDESIDLRLAILARLSQKLIERPED